MVQAVNYSVIGKIKCKTHNITNGIKCHNVTNRNRLSWCELINPYNLFFVVNMFHHMSRKTSRRDIKIPETLKSLMSFKVSASVSEAATSRLGLGSEGLVYIPASIIQIIHSIFGWKCILFTNTPLAVCDC